jgi:DNA-binding ferritin-like protein (Dps family)
MIRLNEKITYREIEDSILIITPWDNAMHTLENIAKLIFEALLNNKNKKEILDEILDTYDVDKVKAQEDLDEFIDSLIKREIFIREV